ncbi:class I SAM-dependent methyltransferase [Aurantivibrio plasticivorans]
MLEEDVPSPIDLKNLKDAQEWEKNTMRRPFRLDFFEAFFTQLSALNNPSLNVLELGSGPGFLAEYLLSRLPTLKISLLDNSPAMHSLAESRLGKYLDRVEFIEADFKQPHWNKELGTFDAVITLQAVHELRHKRYAAEFHKQVRPLLGENGVYLFCDHYCGTDAMQNDQLYMSIEEQRQSLAAAGFFYQEILNKGGRCLYNAF